MTHLSRGERPHQIINRATALAEAVEAALASHACEGCDTKNPAIWLILKPCNCRFTLCVGCAISVRNDWAEIVSKRRSGCQDCGAEVIQIRWEAL